jgi:leukotriene-A4 hydrolase
VRGKAAQFSLGTKHKIMGSALCVSLPENIERGSSIDVKIEYKTAPSSTALQWLAKEQTQGKQWPYLFSQCQPIYARAVAPLQDSPSVKITYSASVACVLPVLMSAIRQSPPSDGPAHKGKKIGKDIVTYKYEQPIPIPSYLIAIAAGNVRYRGFPKMESKTWTSGIWAEPEMLDAAYWEFCEDTGRFLDTEESIVVPYSFGVYDLLVLPPSFPYGGMENACLTFLTPTLLTGDRALVDVVVHELTHSFFGNGVTHAHASHFWLNEGWTTYMERLLLQVIYSPAERGFSFIIGAKALKDALKQYENQPKYQRLVIDFEPGEDPDDAYSSIPYEKGANLILHIERTLGGVDVLLPYVRDYVQTFIGKSITTTEWKDHLYNYFERNGGQEKVDALNTIDWDAWFFGEGLELPVKMDYDTSLARDAYDLAARWDASRTIDDVRQLEFTSQDLKGFNTNQIIVFLERLQSYVALPSTHVLHLGTTYGLAATQNAEVRLRYYEVALMESSGPTANNIALAAARWVTGDDETGVVKGRMKFCRPTFRAISHVNRELAEKWFKDSKECFHPIAQRLIEKVRASLISHYHCLTQVHRILVLLKHKVSVPLEAALEFQ